MKKIFYVILALIALYFILAFFGPSEIRAERSIFVNAPVETVREKLGNYQYFHDRWSPWTRRDTTMKTEYSGDPGKPGHKHRWSGNSDVGSGEMEIASFSGDTIVQKIHFERGGDAQARYIAEKAGEGTKVTWIMHSKVGFMGRTPMLFMNMEKMMGDDFEEGLQNLKKAIEGEPAAANKTYEINEQKWNERVFLSTKKEKMAGEQCGVFLGKNLPKLYEDVQKNGLTPAMAPSMIFYSWDEKTMVTECQAAMAVEAGDKKTRARVNSLTQWEKCVVPKSKVLHVAYYGDYSNNMDAHVQIENYMKEKGLEKDLVIEEYVTDPGVEKDTAKWLTNIYYVIK
jgi:effector-binding domain-containing protein